ncbi:MAG: YhcH/YjgK/YiaL family protein [Candidatus Gastranaerophilaceae bacterium]|nr:putative uncharacterized protein [Clostridium sp. CAG:967]
MIYDKLNNINKYNVISEKVSDFLLGLTPEIAAGRYVIDENTYVNIDVYNTKDFNNCKLEAHKKYIDIQMLLTGNERLDYINTDGLKVSEEYDENRDIMFFETPDIPLNSVQLTPYNFALIYPHEAHMPQINYNNKTHSVKKAVVKIKI